MKKVIHLYLIIAIFSLQVNVYSMDDEDSVFTYGSDYLKQSVMQSDMVKMTRDEIDLRNMLENKAMPGEHIGTDIDLKGPRAGNEGKATDINVEEWYDVIEEIQEEDNGVETVERSDVPDEIIEYMNNRQAEVYSYKMVYSESLYKLIWVEFGNDNCYYKVYLKVFDDKFEDEYAEDVLAEYYSSGLPRIDIIKFANGNFACLWSFSGIPKENDGNNECAIQVFNPKAQRIGEEISLVRPGFGYALSLASLSDKSDKAVIYSTYKKRNPDEQVTIFNIRCLNENGIELVNESDIKCEYFSELYCAHKMKDGKTALVYGVKYQPQYGGQHADMAVQLVHSDGRLCGKPLLLENNNKIEYGTNTFGRIIDFCGAEDMPNGNIVLSWVNNREKTYKLRIISAGSEYIGGIHNVSYYDYDRYSAYSAIEAPINPLIKILSTGNIAYLTTGCDVNPEEHCLNMGIINKNGENVSNMANYGNSTRLNITVDKIFELKDRHLAVIWRDHNNSDEWHDKVYMQVFESNGCLSGNIVEISRGKNPVKTPEVMETILLGDGKIMIFLNGYSEDMGYIGKYMIVSSKGEVVCEKVFTTYPDFEVAVSGCAYIMSKIYNFDNGNFLFVWPEHVCDPNIRSWYNRFVYQIFNKNGKEVTERRVFIKYDSWDDGGVSGHKIQLLPDGNMALLWTERCDAEGKCVVGTQLGNKQDAEYYYGIYMRVVDPEGIYMTDIIELDQKADIFSISIEDIKLHGEQGFELFWKIRGDKSGREILKKTTRTYAGEKVDINPYNAPIEQSKTQTIYTRQPILVDISQNRSSAMWYYWFWRVRTRSMPITETRKSVFESSGGEGSYVKNAYLNNATDYGMVTGEDLKIQRIVDMRDKDSMRTKIERSINNRVLLAALQGDVGQETELGILVKVLGAMDRRTDTEELALKASSLVVEIKENVDNQDMKEFETIINLILAVDAFGSMEEKKDLMIIRETLEGLIEGHKSIYSEYLMETKEVYHYIAEILGVDVERESLPCEYRHLAAFNKHAEIKIAVDLALRDIQAKDIEELTDTEREALYINASKLIPLKDKYISNLRGIITRCIRSIKEHMGMNGHLAVHGDKDGINAFFLFDSSYIKEKAKL